MALHLIALTVLLEHRGLSSSMHVAAHKSLTLIPEDPGMYTHYTVCTIHIYTCIFVYIHTNKVKAHIFLIFNFKKLKGVVINSFNSSTQDTEDGRSL